MKLKILFVVCFLAALTSFTPIKETKNDVKVAKNVILLISDGAGLSQISSSFYYKETESNYTRFKNIGLIKTSSSKQKVTDSAAGATAFASGIKTYNGAIGVSDDSTHVKNLVEIASLKNIKTGVVSTSSITHATPACFYAHTLKRSSEEIIAQQLAQSEIDFFAGGGIDFFTQRQDEQNLIKELVRNEFAIDTTSLGEFSKIKSNTKAGYLLAKDGMPTMEEGRGDFLSQATELGIQFLNKENSGFFIMTEGAQIDWGGHDNNASYLVSEMLDFDDAVGKALDFAEKDGSTLVIVTSDHETGGFTLATKKKVLEDGSTKNDYSEIELVFSTNGHSASLIPVFAFGPGSENFNGVYENTGIFDKILEVTGWNK